MTDIKDKLKQAIKNQNKHNMTDFNLFTDIEFEGATKPFNKDNIVDAMVVRGYYNNIPLSDKQIDAINDDFELVSELAEKFLLKM